MRISDWSSDVCSSDLRTLARRRAPALSRCAGEGLDARNHRRLTGGTENGNPVRKITMGKLSIITAAVIASCVAGCGDTAPPHAAPTPPPAAREPPHAPPVAPAVPLIPPPAQIRTPPA